MSRSQRLWFKAGCWAALATAVVHLLGHLAGPPAPTNATERQLLTLFEGYRFPLPGPDRSLAEFMAGFSLIFCVFMAMLGGLNLLVVRRAVADGALMATLTQLNVACGVTATAISLTYFFVVPTILIAVVTVCFAGALVAGRATPQA